MTAQGYTIAAYVVVGVLMWGYAGMLLMELRRRGRRGAEGARDD
jgi:hypothetical protein